ncbi:MAG: hypothetical protein Q8N52_05935 [Acidobacteriota bacterium]|nr:hypothetical protein [Acidobacteriota bacterium]MDP2389850.1 hypothetical protein [Acidobacteriota bacterium]
MPLSDRSIWTMVHGIGLSGAALAGLFAALFCLHAMAAGRDPEANRAQARALSGLLLFTAAALWASVLVGTFVVFPEYRLPPPAGTVDLGPYPRALLLGNPDTAWLHAFAMECKEHMPWIAAMLATAVAFVSKRYRSQLLTDPSLRRATMTMLLICFAIVGFIGLLGTLVNKVAPLQ